ncbi:Uncharacterized protein BM_BM17089 [Brugia malayi]|uniref:Uncharacterized protein n=1 Tax=Brugia malayi TaxID=6279 RepID=A0A4E9FRC8_BRUMA|nr:Uncharacterized protein BM_BM17089 [Brugia malayi]VIO99749.1 Uncharacterized protein BM_BM17089 [Brugia malayi]
MIITLGLTIISMFLPGLKEFQQIAANISDDLRHFKIPKKFVTFESLCRIASNDNFNFNDNTDPINYCKHWFHQLEDWEKIVIILMCLSVIMEIITICWTLISFFGCCCRKVCMQLLPMFSLIIALLLAAAITIFAINNQKVIHNIDFANLTRSLEIKIQNETARRFYLACSALAVAIIDIFVGSLNLCFLKFCC